MKRQLLDIEWSFSLNGGDAATVNLPHDFSIGRPRLPDSRMSDRGGFFQGGNGVYRKTLPSLEALGGGAAVLEIEGAYMNAEVWVNENLCVFHPYGYTSFHADLTPWMHSEEENALEIRVSNDALPNSRWYSGSGLYRHVWLLTGKDAFIKPWGVFAATTEAYAERSVVRVETELEGRGLLRHTLTDAAGRIAAAAEAFAEGNDSQEMILMDANLWSTDDPYLYTLESELLHGGEVLDTVETKIGIRSIALDTQKGFLLNGKPIKFRGGCLHHDCGILGAAAWDAAEERKAKAHKDAGFNAVRCAHNPPSPAFLDACDRLGLLVIDEAFDCWRMGKTAYDYHLYFDAHWQDDISSMVLRDRNHPAIVFWSTGNEIPERLGASGGYSLAAELAKFVRKLDGTRFVTNSMNGSWAEWTEEMDRLSLPFSKELDAPGYNYHWKKYCEMLERHSRFLIGTETVPWEAMENMQESENDPRVLGDFVWTSLDYFGEAGLGHAYLPGEDGRTHGLSYPWHIANCGDLDICCRPRPQSIYRQILWKRRAAPWIAVHRPNEKGLKPDFNFWGWGDVHHSWSWPGCEGYRAYVDVYSDADEVELFADGKSLGRKQAGIAARNIALFETTYEPGELLAVAYCDGRVTGEDRVATCGKPEAIALTADTEEIPAAWGGLAYITATVVDASGAVVPYAGNELRFSVSGSGAILALGTNDPLSEELYVGEVRKAFEGTVVLAVRSSGTPGAIELTAQAEGLKACSIKIQAR